MKFTALLATLALVFAPPALADGPPPVTAFVHVNLVPMDSERVLRDQTVIVRDGRIEKVGKGLAAPPGARVVDGAGAAWLVPGLIDGHTHSDTADELKVYLAHGITSVVDMGGARQSFVAQVMPAVNAGRRPGPHVYAAFRVDGSPRYGQFVLRTPDEARWAVRLARTNGYSFIKAYNDLAPEVFQALAEESRAQGLPLVGHGVTAVGLPAQLAAGQRLVAHLEEFLYTGPAAPAAGASPSDAAIPAVVALVKQSGAFVGADLVTYAGMAEQWGRPEVVEGYLAAPSAALVSPAWRTAWRRAGYAGRSGDIGANLAFLERLAKALSDAGAPLVAGTDAPTIPGVAPGVSLLNDLDRLRAAGLTPYQALDAATRTPGRLLALAEPQAPAVGVIAPGARADLLLVAADPLAGLGALRRPLGVMAAGRWYDAPELQAMLDETARGYRQSTAP